MVKRVDTRCPLSRVVLSYGSFTKLQLKPRSVEQKRRTRENEKRGNVNLRVSLQETKLSRIC